MHHTDPKFFLEISLGELPQVIFIPQLKAAEHHRQLEDDSERFVRALD